MNPQSASAENQNQPNGQTAEFRMCVMQEHTVDAAALYFTRMLVEMGIAEFEGVDDEGELVFWAPLAEEDEEILWDDEAPQTLSGPTGLGRKALAVLRRARALLCTCR